MPSVNPGNSQNQVRNSRTPLLAPALSSREIATQRRNKILKIASVSILSALAIGTAAAGITLAIVLGSPVFAALAIASVLFAGVAILVYKQLTQKADGDWIQALDQDFRALPATVADANFVIEPGAQLSFYQNKKNPGVKLGMREDVSGFSIKFSALPRSNTARTVTSQRGITFNAVPPAPQTQIAITTNQARALVKELTKLGEHSNWGAAQYQGQTSIISPFAPTEARSTPLNIKNSKSIPLLEKEKYPERIGHIRGPKLDEFSGSDQDVINGYYNRALYAYESCIKEAIEKECSIISVPLFSSVYELDAKNDVPQKNKNYEWMLGCNNLCKKALVEAVNNAALSNPNSLKLLILLQDPFAPLP